MELSSPQLYRAWTCQGCRGIWYWWWLNARWIWCLTGGDAWSEYHACVCLQSGWHPTDLGTQMLEHCCISDSKRSLQYKLCLSTRVLFTGTCLQLCIPSLQQWTFRAEPRRASTIHMPWTRCEACMACLASVTGQGMFVRGWTTTSIATTNLLVRVYGLSTRPWHLSHIPQYCIIVRHCPYRDMQSKLSTNAAPAMGEQSEQEGKIEGLSIKSDFRVTGN